MGLVRGQTGHAREVSALAKVILLTKTAKQSPGPAGERRKGCTPSCPFGRPSPFSRLLAPLRVQAWTKRGGEPNVTQVGSDGCSSHRML